MNDNHNEQLDEFDADIEQAQETADQTEPDALEIAQREAAEFKDKYLRAVAEMDNLRKRAARDVEDAGKYSVTSAARPFLTVADNLERALQSVPEDVADNIKTLLDGIRATQRELKAALERMGVTPIIPQTGEALNPHEHEVMFEVPTENHPNGAVMQVLENGYKIHDRLLRPARVAVAKNNAAAPTEKAMDISA